MKRTVILITLVFFVFATAGTAAAGDRDHWRRPGGGFVLSFPGFLLPPIPLPVPPPSRIWLPGHWEYVDVWIPGHYVEVWVPDGRDSWGRYRRGYYEKRYREGYYEKRKVWREGAWRGEEGRKRNDHRGGYWRENKGHRDRMEWRGNDHDRKHRRGRDWPGKGHGGER